MVSAGVKDTHVILLYSPDLKLVPLLVGSVSPPKVEQLAPVLAELWNDPETFFVISSDFCHW